MSTTRIEISCPHCMRVYRLRVDLRTLAGTRSTARCGRCGRRFSLTKRVHDSGVMTAPITPAAREVSSAPPPRERRAAQTFCDTDPTPQRAWPPVEPSAPAEPRHEEAARRMAATPPEGLRGRSHAEAALEPIPPGYASEPPRDSQPLVALQRRATQPQIHGTRHELSRRGTQPSLGASLEDAFAEDDGREEACADTAERLRMASPPPQNAELLAPLASAPVGGAIDGLVPLDSPFGGDELTPAPSEASASEWALDPDEWVARADPGLDALSAAHSEAAVALRWLLLEDRPAR
jgi:predicted Zn finger-like uncharacterized protein